MTDQINSVEPTAPKQPDSVQETPTYDKPVFKQGIPILEVGESTHPGTLTLPTYSRAELQTWLTKLETEISKKQNDRKEATETGSSDFYPLDLTPEQEDITLKKFILITQQERDVLTSIRQQLAYSHNAYDESGFLDNSPIENLPTVKMGNQDVPIGIMTEGADTIKNPVRKVRAKMGLLVSRTAPLWNSGFRVQIDGPSGLDCLNLDTALISEKIDMAFQTFGYALTSLNVYMDRILIDFILDHIYRSTCGTVEPDKLARLIKLNDYDTLVLTTASAMYPDGFTLERQIFQEKQGQIVPVTVKSKLNPHRMLGVKSSRFTVEQKQRIARTTGTISITEIKQHQADLRPDVNRFIKLKAGMMLKLHVPSLEEYLRIGLGWHTRVKQQIDDNLRKAHNEDERKIYLARATNMSRLMYVSHWVEGFYLEPTAENPEPMPIDDLQRLDPDTHSAEKVNFADLAIEEVLRDTSADSSECERILEEIDNFVVAMRTTSAIVTREANAEVLEGEHPKVITVNPAELFFTLLRHKILEAGG